MILGMCFLDPPVCNKNNSFLSFSLPSFFVLLHLWEEHVSGLAFRRKTSALTCLNADSFTLGIAFGFRLIKNSSASSKTISKENLQSKDLFMVFDCLIVCVGFLVRPFNVGWNHLFKVSLTLLLPGRNRLNPNLNNETKSLNSKSLKRRSEL